MVAGGSGFDLPPFAVRSSFSGLNSYLYIMKYSYNISMEKVKLKSINEDIWKSKQ